MTFIQFGCHFRLLEKRRINPQLIHDLEMNDGVLYREQSIPVITNEGKFPERPEFLPSEILLSNKSVLRLKKKENLMLPNVPLTLFGLRVLVEPFNSEDELQEDIPNEDELTRRLNSIFPKSNFVVTN